MATTTINALTNATTIDPVQDLLPIYQNSTVSTLSINRNNFLNLTSQPVGISDIQTLTNKTLTSPTLNAGTFSGTFTGTYTLAGTPTFPSNVVLTTASQVLTNKTLTSPIINTPTINTPTISGGSGSSMTLSSASLSSSTINTSSLTGGTTVTGGMTLTGGLTADSLTISGVSATTGWNALNQTLTYTGNNGNKEFTITSTANLTGTLNAGMKLQVTRSTTAPTQCMSFVSASSQYASNASPSGITFTSAFTCEAWIYLTSYTSAGIISRYTTNTGFGLQLLGTGQLQIFYGSGSALTDVTSYQSVPLNQWVHVAGVISSTSSKTGNVYINGISAPSYSVNTGAASLSQGTGPLEIGATGNLTNYFPGQISEARLWSTALSQSQIQANMAINLVGTETGLVGLWRGNGDFTDRTTNANNLTAQGGAIATYAANPYNTIEYGIITKAVYAGGVTTLTVYTGNSNTIPNMTLNTPYYSNARAPYGFSADKGNWTFITLFKYDFSINAPTATTVYQFTGAQTTLPTGSWNLNWQSSVYGYKVGTSYDFEIALSSSSSSFSDTELNSYNYITGASGNIGFVYTINKSKNVNVATATNWYFIAFTGSTGAANMDIHGTLTNGPPIMIRAECNYL